MVSIEERQMYSRTLKPILFDNHHDIDQLLAKLSSKLNQEHRRLSDKEIIQIFSENLIYTPRGTFLLDDVLQCKDQHQYFLTAPNIEVSLDQAKCNPRKLKLNRPLATHLFEIYQNRLSTFPYHFNAPKDPNTHLPILLPRINVLEETCEQGPELYLNHPNGALQSLISLRFGLETQYYNRDKLVIELRERLEAYQHLEKKYQQYYKTKQDELHISKILYDEYADLKEKSHSKIHEINHKAEKRIRTLKKQQQFAIFSVFLATIIVTSIILSAIIASPIFITIPAIMYITLIVGPPVALGACIKLGKMVLNKVNSHFETKISEQENIQSRIKSYYDYKPKMKQLKKLNTELAIIIEYIKEIPTHIKTLLNYFQPKGEVKLSDCDATLYKNSKNKEQDKDAVLLTCLHPRRQKI